MNMVKHQKRPGLLKKILIISVIFACICRPLLVFATTAQINELREYHVDTEYLCLMAEDAELSDRQVREILNSEDPEQLLRLELQVRLRWLINPWGPIDVSEVAVDYELLEPKANEEGYPVTISHQNQKGYEIGLTARVFVYREEEPEPPSESETESESQSESESETQSEKQSETESETQPATESEPDTEAKPDPGPGPAPDPRPPIEPLPEPTLDDNGNIDNSGNSIWFGTREPELPEAPQRPSWVPVIPPRVISERENKQTEVRETENGTEKVREKTTTNKREVSPAVVPQSDSGGSTEKEQQSESASGDDEGPAEPGILEYIGKHAYVVTFGGAGVAAVGFGFSVAYDIRTLIWYQKKKNEMKLKRRMMKKRG